jgi:RluA family pseudouridine synthase
MDNFDLNNFLLYKDSLVIVINKLPGIAVHDANLKTDNIGKFFHQITFGLPNPPELAHRLDMGTSGCLILGRHRKALQKLGELFLNHKIVKKYHAILSNTPHEEFGTINAPIAKISTKKNHWHVKIDQENGKESITEYKVLRKLKNNMCLVEFTPITGRTHQLRIHAKHINCPIMDDYLYNKDSKNTNKQIALHAKHIEIPIYKDRSIIVDAPYFENITRYL